MLDPELLEKALRSAEALSAAERAADLARGDFHAAVRRLHLAGAPLRGIARALSISHQRAQQIVDAAGGSWWRRAWRSRNATHDAACSYCGKAHDEVAKLLPGPNVFICDGCVTDAEAVLADPSPACAPVSHLQRGTPRSRLCCSFCARRAETSLAVASYASICAACLALCREIIAESAPAP